MAELRGVLKITGKLGGLSFYKMNGKIITRNPGGFEGDKIRNNEKYGNVRNNASDFGRCSKFGAKLRRALQPFIKDFSDSQLHGRMAKMLYDIMKLDIQSGKGERTVQLGLQHAESTKILEEFVWNLSDGKSCRYDDDKRMIFFDRIPAGSTKAEVTLRFINPSEEQNPLKFEDAVYEVSLPSYEFVIPEDESFEAGRKDLLKFALIRFFDGSGLPLRRKTAVVLG